MHKTHQSQDLFFFASQTELVYSDGVTISVFIGFILCSLNIVVDPEFPDQAIGRVRTGAVREKQPRDQLNRKTY